MKAFEELSLSHASAVRARGNALPPDGLPATLVLDSWVRCMDGGLDATAPLTVQVVPHDDLVRRRECSEFVRRLARAELETLSQQIAGSNFLLAFADHDGVILDLYADNRFSMSGSNAGIVAGSRWSEPLCGTNGLGTALAAGQSVAVTGMEHYFHSLGQISCTATPVRDAAGAIVGVLDASSYFESRQRHTQALVQMAVAHIENGVLVHQMRQQLVLAIHPRAEYLNTLSAGLLAFDETGQLQAANARATSLLAGLDATRGCHFETLFGEPFEHVLARLHVGNDARLRDALGSALVASVVSRPPSRRVMAPRSHARLPVAAAVRTGSTPPRMADAAFSADFVAADPAVAEACRMAQAAVRMGAPILIYGETGSGKELLARHAHAVSGRRGAFVAVNCAAIPDELFEAELFGHVGGAFTGARRDGSTGLIAAADGGTLLLDEVGELPLPMQAALLRFLDDQQVRAVGATQSRHVNVQLLAASNVDLAAAVAAKRFREDLLYRLDVVKLRLPPLRERSDFALAARSVLAQVDAGAQLSEGALARLAQQPWPGNFRELRSTLTRMVLAQARADGSAQLNEHDVPAQLAAPASAARGSALQHSATDQVLRAFEASGRSVSATARRLGVSRTTVYRHLREGAPRAQGGD